MRQAGRWVGRWWHRNEGPLRLAAGRAHRRYVRLAAAVTLVAFAWVGVCLALGALQLMESAHPLPVLVGGAGGGLAGAVHRRDRLRRLDGHPPMRHAWLPAAAWLAALALTLALTAH